MSDDRHAALPTTLIFAKYPQPGAVKTRMVPPLTFEQAAKLHRLSLQAVCEIVFDEARLDAKLVVTPDDTVLSFDRVVGRDKVTFWPQGGGDLGDRLFRAVDRLFREGGYGAILLGADSPTLPLSYLQGAISLLERHEIVLGPSDDGGYYLLGVRRPYKVLFEHVDWGSSLVAEQTRTQARSAGLDMVELATWYDLDRFDNLKRATDDLCALTIDELPAHRQLREFLLSLMGD